MTGVMDTVSEWLGCSRVSAVFPTDENVDVEYQVLPQSNVFSVLSINQSINQSVNQFICRKEVSHKHGYNNVVQLIDKTYKAHKEHLTVITNETKALHIKNGNLKTLKVIKLEKSTR